MKSGLSPGQSYYQVEVMINPHSPCSVLRTFFPIAKNHKRAEAKCRKRGQIVSCHKVDASYHLHKIEYLKLNNGHKKFI